jgi:glyoxylase-like metal-dependent hydrolase (beta-lactamase superfamily II)/rhodanese-related sulfurtransferase
MSRSPTSPGPRTSAPPSHGVLEVLPLPHPQGCRSWLIFDPERREAAGLDLHLDHAAWLAHTLRERGLKLRLVIDSHTHADHPSAAHKVASAFGATRVAHERAAHAGVTHHPKEGETLEIGRGALTVRHAPGHTPDHLVLELPGGVFSGDTLFIGSVARTDFLGGNAGELYDTLGRVFGPLPGATVLYPGHDYAGRIASTLEQERASNPWLKVGDRARFVAALSANPPPKPANMGDLLRFNRDNVALPVHISAADARARIESGAALSVIDVRTDPEVDAEMVPGSRQILLDTILDRVDEVRAIPAPRLLMCKMGVRAARAQAALAQMGVEGLVVIDGGIVAYKQAGGRVVPRKEGTVAPAGGSCSAGAPSPGGCSAPMPPGGCSAPAPEGPTT